MIQIVPLESIISKEVYGVLCHGDPVFCFLILRKTSKRIKGQKFYLTGLGFRGWIASSVPRAHLTPECDFSMPKATSSESPQHWIYTSSLHICPCPHTIKYAQFPQVLMFPHTCVHIPSHTYLYTFPCDSFHVTYIHTLCTHMYKHA